MSDGGALYPGQELAVTDLHYVAPPTVAKADDHYLRGVQSVRNHDYLAALHHFNKATFLAPNEPLPFVARAEAYTHLCDLKSAIGSYRKAVVLMKDPVTVQDLKARLAQVLDAMGVSSFREGQVAAALRFVEESLEEHYDASAELRRVVYLIASNRHEEAETIIASSLIQKPEVRADAAVLLVELHINLKKDFASAKNILETVLQDYGRHPRVLNAEKLFDDAFIAYKKEAEDEHDVEKLTHCVLAFPHDATLYMLRAQGLCNQKQYTAAVQDLFAAIAASGGFHEEASKMMRDILCTIANELVSVGDRVSALNYYSEALKWDDASDVVLLARGDCHVGLEQHEEALKDYQTVHQRNRSNGAALIRLARLHDLWGTVLYQQAKYELAEAEFSKGIMYCDLDPTIFFHRAQCRLMLQEAEYAIRDLMSCRDRNPDDPDMLKMIQQFCPPQAPRGGEEGSSTPRGKGNAGGDESRRRGARPTQQHSSHQVVDDHALDAPTTMHTASMLSQLASSRSVSSSSLEEKFNPLAIREFVKQASTVSQGGNVRVITNPFTGQQLRIQTQSVVDATKKSANWKPRPTPPVDAQPSAQQAGLGGGKRDSREPHVTVGPQEVVRSGAEAKWEASTKPPLSRLDRVSVSHQAPIPKQYVERRRERLASFERETTSVTGLGGNHSSTQQPRVTDSSLDSLLRETPPNSGSCVPAVAPPSTQHRSKLSGQRSTFLLSATAPDQFMFSSKAPISLKGAPAHPKGSAEQAKS